jgi:NAD-dependent SIR2 family protein deacetylase
MNASTMERIKTIYAAADGIVILAGAGMGVDSGIPDFRGKSGLWTEDKSNFLKFATASSFETDPLSTWNFYITRLIAYSNFEPHKGYVDLNKLGKDKFVVTSNVDMQFVKAGYDQNKIVEIHGNLRGLQCMRLCCRDNYAMPKFTNALSNVNDIPRCPKCGSYLRPKVMMFNDPLFLYDDVDSQMSNYRSWAETKSNILGIEIGAGTTVPSIRLFGHERTNALIRINPYDAEVTRDTDVSIQESAVMGIEILLNILSL